LTRRPSGDGKSSTSVTRSPVSEWGMGASWRVDATLTVRAQAATAIRSAADVIANRAA
jgi:hypothetical protein